MNPFDDPFALPPTDAPASTEPPASLHPPSAAAGGGHDGPRRGRMAIAALAAAGLVGVGVVIAGQLASADRPTLDTAATVEEPSDEADEDSPASDTDPDRDAGDDGSDDGVPSIDGEIVIDDADGDPYVLDLGRLGECIGPILRGGPMLHEDGREENGDGRPPLPFDDEFHRRMEQFLDELPWDEMGDLEHDGHDDGVRIFGSGGSTITIVGPDGIDVIDLGEGDATVTIEQRDGELTVETDGDATTSDLPDVGRLLPHLELDPGELDPGELEPGELGADWDGLDLSELLPFDLDEMESCVDDLGSGDDGS